MLRPSHLPPRCPPIRGKDDDLHNLIRFPSLGTILEEQPSWLDDLLTDSDVNVNPKRSMHRRSSSDSAAILEAPANLQCQISNASEGNDGLSVVVAKPLENCEGGEVCSGLEGTCVYGPNSPRQKSNLSNSEVSALMESIPPSKLQYVTVDFPNGTNQSESNGDFPGAAGDLDPEKAARRRSGQRSRVRKLQYIAELERTVEAYQTMGAELAAAVASLFQQRVALSMENKNLRLQMAGLRQEKTIKDGQYQSLKNEAERLKVIHGRHRRTKSAASCFETGIMRTDPSTATSWQALDFGKLSLGGNPVTSRHGFGH